MCGVVCDVVKFVGDACVHTHTILNVTFYLPNLTLRRASSSGESCGAASCCCCEGADAVVGRCCSLLLEEGGDDAPLLLRMCGCGCINRGQSSAADTTRLEKHKQLGIARCPLPAVPVTTINIAYLTSCFSTTRRRSLGGGNIYCSLYIHYARIT